MRLQRRVRNSGFRFTPFSRYTEPAFLYAQQQGMFSFPDNPNAVWDIGGGTSIARTYLPSGTMVQDAEIILPGTKELAQQVAAEMQATFGLNYSPALADIMDAIARGDCLYGTSKRGKSSEAATRGNIVQSYSPNL
jgi:hypothetical protein